MITRRHSQQFRWLLRLINLWIASVLVTASAAPRWASAQSTDEPWVEPLNLSHSGAATNPSIMIDSDSVEHVIWQDEFANYVYTRFNGSQWSRPQVTELHLLFGLPASQALTGRFETSLYTGPNPLFIAGPGQYIFAFWLTPEGALYGSRVLNRDFMDVTAWDEAKLLSPSAAAFAAAVDVLGELHLAYLRTFDDSVNPAGIYYLGSKNSGLDWSLPLLLYESSYFRRLGRGDANLSLAAAGTADAPLVYIAWDNRPRKQVLLAKSANGGASWEQLEQVVGPAPDSGSARPFNVRVGAKENSAVLVWQSGEPGDACTQFFQSSSDAGVNWSKAQPMLEDLPGGCAQGNEFVVGLGTSPEDPLYLLTNIHSQMFVSAWDGSQWSQPQVQPTLVSFEDPEIYTRVEYGCHRATLFGEQLYVIGCDQSGGGDIWITSRILEANTSWFSPKVWSQPAPIPSENLQANFQAAAVEMVATRDNYIHTFFSQFQDPAIYYTRWDGAAWSLITPVLQLPSGESGWPAVAAGSGNELYLIARSSRGSLYFSRANSSNAVTASRWSTPARLRNIHDGKVSSAEIAYDAAGTIHIAYSVLVNEERGVYLIQSKDQGKNWTEPVQVFDGATAGFDLVGSPSLLVSPNGLLHVLLGQQSIQVDGGLLPISLHYLRSLNADHAFNDAELVVEAPVVWQDIVADGRGNLHRLWQRLDTEATLWHQISFDGGQSWQPAERLPAEEETAAVTVDPVGQLHLVRAGLNSFSHWIWDGSRWRVEAPVRWLSGSQTGGPVELLAAAVTTDGKMVVVLAVPTGESEIEGRLLLYSTRILELPQRMAAIQENTTQAPPSPTYTPVIPTPDRSLTPAATAESGSARVQEPTDPANNSDPMAPYLRALFPVALLLLSVFGFVTRKITRVKDR